MAFNASLADELASLEQKDLRRSLRLVENNENAFVTIDGKRLVNFSSNNYLGLARHPRVVAAAKDALERWGAGASSSRLISGSTLLHRELETALANFLQRGAALLFPSGYMANVGVVTSLVGAGDAIVADRLCHASLIDAAKLSGARLFVYDHANAESAEAVLKRARSYRRRLLITESLFSMNGDLAPLRALARLCRQYDAIGMLDEAHAIGTFGFHGRGILGLEGMDDPWDVVVGTLSKSLGSQGGFVSGSRELIEVLLNRARSFIFTTALAPASCAAAHAALALIEEDAGARVHLQKISSRLREGLRLQGWDIFHSESHIVPIRLGDERAALQGADHLLKEGIFAPAIRPPTVHAGECRIRFSLTAEHTEKEIDLLLRALTPLVA